MKVLFTICDSSLCNHYARPYVYVYILESDIELDLNPDKSSIPFAESQILLVLTEEEKSIKEAPIVRISRRDSDKPYQAFDDTC